MRVDSDHQPMIDLDGRGGSRVRKKHRCLDGRGKEKI